MSSGRGVSLMGAVPAEGKMGSPHPRTGRHRWAGSSPPIQRHPSSSGGCSRGTASCQCPTAAGVPWIPVGWIGQVDPDQADGVVCAGPDRELPLRM